jgi:peroxiredoxin
MSIVVNLPDELGRTIAAEAAKAGMTVSDYVADRLTKAAGGASASETKQRLSGAALVQRWKELGLIGYRSDITDPEAHSRRLREAAQRR